MSSRKRSQILTELVEKEIHSSTALGATILYMYSYLKDNDKKRTFSNDKGTLTARPLYKDQNKNSYMQGQSITISDNKNLNADIKVEVINQKNVESASQDQNLTGKIASFFWTDTDLEYAKEKLEFDETIGIEVRYGEKKGYRNLHSVVRANLYTDQGLERLIDFAKLLKVGQSIIQSFPEQKKKHQELIHYLTEE